MTLEEIKEAVDAAAQRAEQLNLGAKAAKDKATQLKVNADITADHLKMQKAREKPVQSGKTTPLKTIKPHA